MRISDILNQQKNTLSLEVFPPKTTLNYESVRSSVMQVAQLQPDFLSVTYGAGGGTSLYTAQLCKEVMENYGVTAMAHLSCITSTKDMVGGQLRQILGLGLENILALRGDLTEGIDFSHLDYRYASDLVKEIHTYYDFCIGGACYPEGHPEAASLDDDILHIKEKVDAGCEFLTTQMFFDNDLYYRYVEKLDKAGVHVPVIAGIMPITAYRQVERARDLSHSYMPKEFLEMTQKYKDCPQELAKAGVDYAIRQALNLRAQGVGHIHIYTMNKPQVAKAIQEALA
jgi:methylenetetrahydrofolate reductase (NADPH)